MLILTKCLNTNPNALIMVNFRFKHNQNRGHFPGLNTPVCVCISSHPLRGLENFADGTPRADTSQNGQLSSRGVNQCMLYHEVKIILAFQSVQSVCTSSRSKKNTADTDTTDTNALNTDGNMTCPILPLSQHGTPTSSGFLLCTCKNQVHVSV